MKHVTVIYAGTGIELKNMIKKSKIANIVNTIELEKITRSASQTRVSIYELGSIIRVCIAVPHRTLMNKERKAILKKQENIEVLTYPQNNKKIQAILAETTEIKDPKNLFITYFY
jgi:hypothetical protein